MSRPHPPNALRHLLGRILLAGGSVLITLVLVDLALFAVRGPVHLVENFYEPAPIYGYRMRPNLSFEFAHAFHGYRATVHTNSMGLRGPEVAIPKPPGVRRILFIGDSITAGLEVENDATFAAVCGQSLGGPSTVETVNAGVRGYNLDNIIGFLQVAGMRLEPDVVVYTFVENDLTADSTFAPAHSDWSRGPKFPRFVKRLAASSHIIYRLELLRERLKLRAAARQTDAGNAVPPLITALVTAADVAGAPGAELTARRIAVLDSTARAGGARFVLAGAPHRLEVSPKAQVWLRGEVGGGGADFDGARRYLDTVAARIGCARVDPIPEFRARLEIDRDYWFHEDDHLNVRGHRLFGELLAREIAGLLPDD